MEPEPQGARERRKAFLARAEEAEKRAATSTDAQARHAWLEIAASWRFLADRVTRNSKEG
ncbi:MAG TPA: hypothetical protein VMF67_11245 [Rhizomicrobium sp.]|nr:hypothetical protein [Rhizomicrobium sp.]